MRYALIVALGLAWLPLACEKKPQPKAAAKPVLPDTSRTIAKLPEPEPMVRPEPRPRPKPIPLPVEVKPEPKAPPEPQPTERIYLVQKGETLWGIATKELGDGKRHKEIMALNGLTSDKIFVGQRLKLPAK